MRGQAVLVTGSSGLIGTAVCKVLRKEGATVVEADVRHVDANSRADIRDREKMRSIIQGVTGVVHLAAVSRVVHGEMDPQGCWEVNVNGTQTVIELCGELDPPPWFLYASSREVYGQQEIFPVRECAELRPINVYARSKVAAEGLVAEARANGLVTAMARFSNVYGSVCDHLDRVVHAFARAAAQGGEIRVDGAQQTFDFTHLEDVATGILRFVSKLAARERDLPTLHFVSGVPTTLGEIASMAVANAVRPVNLVEAEPRDYDVGRFYGDPSNALEVLGWMARIDLRSGFARLAADVRASLEVPMLSQS